MIKCNADPKHVSDLIINYKNIGISLVSASGGKKTVTLYFKSDEIHTKNRDKTPFKA
jgi:hypothetical protein